MIRELHLSETVLLGLDVFRFTPELSLQAELKLSQRLTLFLY